MAARRTQAPIRPASDWRTRLRRRISWSLLFKLLALLALWVLFFSPQHRIHVTAEAVGTRLSANPVPASDITPARGTDHD